MKKSIGVKFLVVLTIALLAFSPVAYAADKSAMCNPGEEFTVTFDSMGGTAVAPVKVACGGKICEPCEPTLEDYTFDGWYSDEECTSEWDFDEDTVEEDMTLYAGWWDESDDGDEDSGDEDTLDIPEDFTAEADAYKSIALSWESDGDEDGFEIYRARSEGGQYTLLDATEETEYIDTGLVTNTAYYYKVRAYAETDEDTLYSDFTPVVSARPLPAAPQLKAVKSGKKIKASWGKVSGASKYELYYAASQNGKYKLATRTASKSFTVSGLKKGKTYYLKAKAYCMIKGKKVYGGYSDTVAVSLQ